jgi:lipid II:glycine glycyltransferase (peptidoglycan interpeptide bridge formation enzyme)
MEVTAPDPFTATVFDRRQLASGAASAWISTTLSDEEWDSFLQSTLLGQFQQSSIWAAVKAGEGWRVVRVVIWQGNRIVGGFQILSRARKLLREGFLNKGPVYGEPDLQLLEWMLELVERSAKIHRIDALVVQAPDDDNAFRALQERRGYVANGIAAIITATFCIPLGDGRPPAETRMRRTVRLEARQALRRGVVIREGTASDIPDFFQLMCATCRRQNTAPNPASEAALLQLWSAFNEKGLARLTIADCDGKPTAGLLTIRIGNRITQWKKGWNEQFREKHPNTSLAFESIQWSERQNASCVDFVGGDRSFAHAILSGNAPDKELRASRYFFLVGLGAEPRLLPLSQILVPNRLIRAAYQSCLPLLRRLGRVETE